MTRIISDNQSAAVIVVCIACFIAGYILLGKLLSALSRRNEAKKKERSKTPGDDSQTGILR